MLGYWLPDVAAGFAVFPTIMGFFYHLLSAPSMPGIILRLGADLSGDRLQPWS